MIERLSPNGYLSGDRDYHLLKEEERSQDMMCALCRKERPLRKSHIIPEFVFKLLYDNKHKFHLLSAIPTKGNAKLQKGIRKNLLCQECETSFSKYERYVCGVLTGQENIHSVRKGRIVTVSGLDYKKFKLFLLSVLWRAGVSTLDFFESVKLGTHEEILRKMLFAENPGPPDQYGFLMAPLVVRDVVQTDIIVKPSWSRYQGHFCYRFVFGGIIWVCFVSKYRPPELARKAFLSLEGKAVMLVSEMESVSFIMRLAQDLVHMGRA